MDPALETARDEVVAAGLVPADVGVGELTDLVVLHARGLDGLESMRALRTLSLIGCDLDDWDRLADLAAMTLLAVEHSTVADLRWAAGPPLAVLVLRCNRVVDATPLDGIGTLTSVDLRGNPLTPQSYAWARTELATQVALTLDDEEAWELCRALHDAGSPAVVYRDARGLRLAWTGLSRSDAPEAGHPVVDAVDVRDAVGDPARIETLMARGPG
ncbi:MAG: hypothetical protein JWP95_619 [Actinotalea sp.]|nr:hypothetical protein [Actinotalea sp.]